MDCLRYHLLELNSAVIIEAGKVTGSANDLRKLTMQDMKELLKEIGYPEQVGLLVAGLKLLVDFVSVLRS